ncbi:MAG TPA: hypothetical protein DCM32_00200 [Xanthomonadaceae bacterium]|nr:hypothetical protein [Xanthomonadaceae bacterium]
MRDLYARLGLGFGADESALRRAIAATSDRELARRAQAVLLDADRRPAHDAVYLVARRLRDWRVELLLEDAAWATALADSDLVRPDLPAVPLASTSGTALAPRSSWWRRLLGR